MEKEVQVDYFSGMVCEGNKTFQRDFVLALTCMHSCSGVQLCEKSHLSPLRQWPLFFRKGHGTRAFSCKFVLLDVVFSWRFSEG